MYFKILVVRKFHISKTSHKIRASFTDFWQNNHISIQPITNTCAFKENQPKENSNLPIFGEVFPHLSCNSKIKCETMLYFVNFNREKARV